MEPRIQYAKSDDVSIAYRVVGDGPLDVVFVQGWVRCGGAKTTKQGLTTAHASGSSGACGPSTAGSPSRQQSPCRQLRNDCRFCRGRQVAAKRFQGG